MTQQLSQQHENETLESGAVDRGQLMDHLLSLPACTLITTGRTGTDFLQSLLDSHPEVLTFNGSLFIHPFWNSSICVAAGEFELDDLLDEFIGRHIEKLKSRYDLKERKHQLGDDYNQSLNVDLVKFKAEAINLLRGRELNSKNLLVAIYGAYAICLGQDMEKKRLFFHHAHHFGELPNFLQDFPNSKIICMTRDPRANFVSGVEHHRANNLANNFIVGDTDQGSHVYVYIQRILHDATPLERYGKEYLVLKIEDLGSQPIIDQLCQWLGITHHDCLAESTWGGLRWHGDRLSRVTTEVGWSKDVLQNNWESRLSFRDKYVLNYIMNNRLKDYGYSHKRITPLDALIVPFLIPLPLRYEQRFISPPYLRNALRKGEYRKLARTLKFYFKRVALFFRFYVKATRREKYHQPMLSSKGLG